MKKSALSLVISISLLLVIGVSSKLFRQRTQMPSGISPEKLVASPLTQVEEQDLKKMLSLALSSMKTWDGRTDTGCPEVDGKQFNLAEIVKEHEGQEIEMRLDIRQNSLIVFLDELHTYLIFPRLHDLGLAPAEYDVFCEKSYADKVNAQKQYSYWQTAKKNVRDDPELTEIVDRINEKYPSSDYDKIAREEVRTYRVPTLTAKAVEPYDAWNDEKRSLYERVLEVAREEAVLHCQPDKPVRMTIPDFQIGDPDIYVLLDAAATRRTVEWITFSRDVASGKYTAEPAKNLGLADEIKPLIPLIKAKQAKQFTVECRTR